MTVWGRLSSINVQKVTWALDEIALAWSHRPAGGDFGLLETPEFRTLNPHGKVPVIDDDGAVVWESGAILRYLCAAYSEGVLWPAAPGRRAEADQWMDWCQTSLQPHLMGFFWGWYRTPAERRDEARNAQLHAATIEALARLDALLAARPYVAGDILTMGDLPAGTLLYRWYEMDIPRPALPHLEAWYARLGARPAYQAQVMRPFDELKGRLAF
ncbi:MAG: glutathione S-transferase [Proteobacteria bacterium]|nr:glutathione S-transferase [Pseudomonadota bacterium]